jgi:hypothetical protein
LYYGGVSWFRENIVPQLAESAFDSIGDRIIDHITTYEDLYVPSPGLDSSNLFRSAVLKREFLTSIGQSGGLSRFLASPLFSSQLSLSHCLSVSRSVSLPSLFLNSKPSHVYSTNAESFKHEKLSLLINEFYSNLVDESSTSFIDDSIPPSAFMIDAKIKPNSQDLLRKLNTILSTYGDDRHPISLLYSPGSKQRNYFYHLTKFFSKVFVNLRRLFLTFNFSAIIFNILLSLSLYPIMALLLLHGLNANDLFLGICFLVFFPFMFVTVACASSMAEVYRLLIIDVEDGIYSSLSLQVAFMIYFLFSSLVICITSLGAIFVVRPGTGWIELYEALMVMNLDMIFFLGMIYFCVVACAGDPGMVSITLPLLLSSVTHFLSLSLSLDLFLSHPSSGLSQCHHSLNFLYSLRWASHQHLQIPIFHQTDPSNQPALHLCCHTPIPLCRLLLSHLW